MCRIQCLLALMALCVGTVTSWDIVLGVGDQLLFYTNTTKTNTVHLNSHNLAALAYDDVHNMILYVDKQNDNDVIGGYNISSMESKYFTARYGRNIQGIVFDPATEKLFFTDINDKSINWVSLKPGAQNNVHGNRILKLHAGTPTDIAVDSCRGYIYWITTDLITKIERARFDGTERQVVIYINSLFISTTQKLEPHSLVIDQQMQKMFWVEPTNSSKHSTYKSDLNGQNKVENSFFNFHSKKALDKKSNVLTLSKHSLISWIWTPKGSIWEESKSAEEIHLKPKKIMSLDYEIPLGIAANYKVEQQIQGLDNCEALSSVVQSNRIEPFCVHGMKVNGHSPCKCTPGYIGERCDVSVCENYCLQGNCSFNFMGLPQCSCNTGYYGGRCEVDACHGYCSNNGTCSLNEQNKPVCECRRGYGGDKCEVSDCLYYCIYGNCSYNNQLLPQCRCNDGYIGERCEVNPCHGYCLHNGECSLNNGAEPVCQCVGNYEGSRCEDNRNDTFDSAETNQTLAYILSKCLNYCLQGTCSYNEKGLPMCRCKAGYSGERCEVDACHGYCLNNGCCSLNEEEEPVCQCVGEHEGTRCEVEVLQSIPGPFSWKTIPISSAERKF